MIPQSETVQRLIAMWRTAPAADYADDYTEGYMHGRNKCADELEAQSPQRGWQEAARELADAAFDYHVHSELNPVVAGVEKTVRLLKARQAMLDLLPAPPVDPETT